MKTRRLIALLLVAILMLAPLAGCQQQAADPTPAPAADPTPAPADTTPADTDGEAGDRPHHPTGDVDWQNFRFDPAQIPQDLLDTEVHLAVSIRGLHNPYLVTKIQGMYMFGEFLDSIGQRNSVQVLESGGVNAVEIDNIRAFAALAGENGLVYSDPNESAIAPALAEAMAEAGGFIGTAWNRPDDVGPLDFSPNWVVHTSADNVSGGYETARALFEFMGGEGYVFVIEGMLGNTASIDRVRGLEMALAAFPGITVAHQDTGNWNANEALTLVETWLSVTPDVGGVWCANDNMAAGALQALDNAGLAGTVGVTGIDANIDIIEEIANGRVVATVSSNGFLQSGYTLAIAYAAWVGFIDPNQVPVEFRDFLTPAMLVTSANVDNFIATYVESTPTFDFTQIFYGWVGNA